MKNFLLCLLALVFLIPCSNAQQQLGASIINSTDVVGTALPFQIADNPTGYTFGTNTFGRQIRLSRQNNLYYYDMGLDANSQFYLTARNTATPALTVGATGYVGIGVTSPQNLLDVDGTVHAKQVKVDLNGLADFVFYPAYRLRPLGEVDEYIRRNGHLPDVPSADEVAKKGLDLGNAENVLLMKVEELTLYTIEQQKEIEELKKEIAALKNR